MNMMPLNLVEEKKKFFFDPNYNPQFVYEQEIPDEVLYKYGPFGGELADKALKIIETVIKKWGSESKYLDEVEGELLSREEATQIILDYLQKCGLQNKVKLYFSSSFIPRTHMDGYTMNIRLPVEYRKKGIYGMLHHEIGTHVFRRINDEKQPWHNKRKEFGLGSYLETEEGLAVLHYYMDVDEPYMWINSVQYYACFLASKMPFSLVYKELKKYIDDKERRFKISLRAKRGMIDTSKPGGYTKDQLYLRGVVKVKEWLQKHEYDPTVLYLGKISIENLENRTSFSAETLPSTPFFMKEANYKKKLHEILKYNKFI